MVWGINMVHIFQWRGAQGAFTAPFPVAGEGGFIAPFPVAGEGGFIAPFPVVHISQWRGRGKLGWDEPEP